MAKTRFTIKADSLLVLEIVILKGRGSIDLDRQTLFQDVNAPNPTQAIMQILPEGDHKLDITASDFGDTKYDMKVNVKVEQDAGTAILLTTMRLASSGNEKDTSDGATMLFRAVRRL